MVGVGVRGCGGSAGVSEFLKPLVSVTVRGDDVSRKVETAAFKKIASEPACDRADGEKNNESFDVHDPVTPVRAKFRSDLCDIASTTQEEFSAGAGQSVNFASFWRRSVVDRPRNSMTFVRDVSPARTWMLRHGISSDAASNLITATLALPFSGWA